MTIENLGWVQAIKAGTTPPTNTKMIWFDENPGQFVHKSYNSTTATWEPTTSFQNVRTYNAGASVSSGRVVALSGGAVIHHQPTTPTEAVGIALNAGILDDPIKVALSGGTARVSGWGLTPGARYFVGSNGVITDDPSGITGQLQEVGVALTTEILSITLQEPITL